MPRRIDFEMTSKRIAAVAELEVGGLARVEVDGMPMCLVHIEDGQFYCVDDLCSHEQASLSEGGLLGAELECPMHGSLFDVRTGAVRGLPATEPVRTYASPWWTARSTSTPNNQPQDLFEAAKKEAPWLRPESLIASSS